MFEKTFILGESKWIDVEVRSKVKCNLIIIPFADYTLYHIDDNPDSNKIRNTNDNISMPDNFVIEEFGKCTIEENTISAKITPKQRGLYLLKIKYTVADEVRIVMVKIYVY